MILISVIFQNRQLIDANGKIVLELINHLQKDIKCIIIFVLIRVKDHLLVPNQVIFNLCLFIYTHLLIFCKIDCEKKFSRPDSLTTHIKTHSNVRPFVCGFKGCGKAYYHSRSLKKHEKIHEITEQSPPPPPPPSYEQVVMTTNNNFDPMQAQLLQQQQQQQQLTSMPFDTNMSYYQSPQQPPSLNTTPTPTNTSFNSTTPVNFNFPTTTATTPTTAVNTSNDYVIANNNIIQNYMGSSPLSSDH